jgi:hypothetical protein
MFNKFYQNKHTSYQPSEGSSISFSTEDFPSGVYYCTLNSGMNRITKSFVVVK